MSWAITRTISVVRRLRSLIGVCLLVLLATPAAQADFTPVVSPLAGQSVHGFAASRGAWMVGLSGSAPAVQARITRDHGQTWATVAFPAGPGSSVGQFSGVTVGPDGAFYVAARYPVAVASGAFARLLRVDPGDGVVSIVDTLPVPAAGAALSAPAFDAQARVWVAWVSAGSSTLTVARIAGGAVAETYQAAAPSSTSVRGEIQFRASGMWARMGDKTYRLSGGALVLAPQGIPTLEDGPLVIASDKMSFDGGQSYGLGGTQRTIEVEGDAKLLGSTNGIMRRYSPSMFSATTQTWPQTGPLVNRLIATDGGLVALEDEWRSPYGAQGWRMLWHSGAVTDPPFANGPMSATFTSWLTEANAYRAQAGLPPLLGDSAISAAAENHSRYWTLNPHVGDAHSETPGAPGFTGISASDRCVAAGGPFSCFEVMYGGPDPVSWWISTPNHRSVIMNPTVLSVGGGQVPGGLAVMNSGDGGGLLVGPVMFPRGAYTGPLEHSGEYPDAATECQQGGQQVTAPLGPAVSVSVPLWGILSGFTLSPAGGQPLRACVLGGLLLTDDPLQPRTTYDATVLWQPSAATAAQRLSWQFTTGADVSLRPSLQTFLNSALPGPPSATSVPPNCTPSLRRTSARVTRPTKIAIRVRACGAGTATVGVYRRRAQTARQRRALTYKRVTVGAAGTTTVRVATRSLRPGRYALRITLKGAKARKLNTTITIAAAKPRR